MSPVEFDELYLSSYARLVAQLHAVTGGRDEAEERVREAFVRAWAHRRRLAAARTPEARVRATAYRLAAARRRSAAGEGGPAPVAALRELSEEQRVALALHHLADLPVSEVARETGAPESTVADRISQGRAALADLFGDGAPDRLRDALGALPVHPSPAADVRRAGDRRRRRTGSLLAGGAALAVAAVVVPLALPGGQARSGGTTAVARPWARTIPDGFPLAAGLGSHPPVQVATNPVADPGASGLVVVASACSEVAAWSAGPATTFAQTRDPTGARRTLALYADDRAAAAALLGAQRAVARCGGRRVPAGTLLPRPLTSSSGESSYAFVRPDGLDGWSEEGWSVTILTRVGNAVLVDQAPARPLPVPSDADPLRVSGQAAAEEMTRRAVRVVSGMCGFAALPCASGDPATDPG